MNEATGQEPLPEQVLDATIARLQLAPLCCHCGAGIQGAMSSKGRPFNCPACKGLVRCVHKGIWLEAVSPLDLDAPPPVAGRKGQRH